MPWVPLNTLTNGDFIDFDIIDQLISNVNYLRDAVPEIHVRRPTGTVLSASGETETRLRIQGGQERVSSFKGTHDVAIKLIKPHTGTADYPVTLSPSSQIDVRLSLFSQTNNQFVVRIIPTTKSSIRGLKINWNAITQE